MNDKFDPATVDKYSESSVTAVKEDLEADDKLKAGLIGGSFPASDPASAAQPSPSEYDANKG